MPKVFLLIATIFVLWIGRGLFIPLLVAIFVWYLLNAISSYYRQALPDEKIWNYVAPVLSLATFGAVAYLFITQIQPMFSDLAVALPGIQSRMAEFGNYISDRFGVSFGTTSLSGIAKFAAGIGSSAAGIAGTIGMALVYLLFIFVEQSTFSKKLDALMPNKTRAKKTRFILQSIDANMKKYLFMKTLVSAITAVLSYFFLQYLGLDFAGLWAFIIFITSYIPTFGAIVACGLPILYALITADSLQVPILTAIGLIGMQILFGNILEPKLTGKTLNLSTLAILINLVFWGMLWGVAGMFFSVPILVATFIITAQFDSTRWIAILLSADGKIPEIEAE